MLIRRPWTLDIPISEGVDNHLAESGRYGAQSVKQGRSWFDLASCTHIARSYNAENGRSGSGGDEDTLWPSGQSQNRSCIGGPVGIGFPPGEGECFGATPSKRRCCDVSDRLRGHGKSPTRLFVGRSWLMRGSSVEALVGRRGRYRKCGVRRHPRRASGKDPETGS